MAATFLAALMWRGLANSVTLATTTHRKRGEMSDGTDTQVKVQMINKYKVPIPQRGYIRKGSPHEDWDRKEELITEEQC